MARTSTAALQLSKSIHERGQRRSLQLVAQPTAPTQVDVEHLEIAYGGVWEVFDSDDIDALRQSSAVWIPPAPR